MKTERSLKLLKYTIRKVRKRSFGHVRPANIQISLRFCVLDGQGCKVSACGLRGLVWIFVGSTCLMVRFLTLRSHQLEIQSTLVISTSFISNNPVLTWNSIIWYQYCGKKEKQFLFHNIFNISVSLRSIFSFFGYTHPHPPPPRLLSWSAWTYSPDNRAHIKGLSYLRDYEVIIRILGLPKWGPIRDNSYNWEIP